MKKAIVTTTINEPTQALLRFLAIAERDDWYIYVVGDQKTPHDAYMKLAGDHPRLAYISPKRQESKYKPLSDLIGWNCIQRRNIGFIEAWKWGADVIATVDDDNIPYPNWGQNLAVGTQPTTSVFATNDLIFDPLSATNHPGLWHRGFPIELLATRNRVKFLSRSKVRPVLVQADLWDGEPDVDAIARIALGPFDCRFTTTDFFTSTSPGPFNSQNTFVGRHAFPIYFMFPHVGRMDDIWASYLLQSEFPGHSVVYGPASVYQERNEHNLVRDLEGEQLGYSNTMELCRRLFGPDPMAWRSLLPAKSIDAWEVYKGYFQGAR